MPSTVTRRGAFRRHRPIGGDGIQGEVAWDRIPVPRAPSVPEAQAYTQYTHVMYVSPTYHGARW